MDRNAAYRAVCNQLDANAGKITGSFEQLYAIDIATDHCVGGYAKAEGRNAREVFNELAAIARKAGHGN